jgi:hypothetical protein
LKQENRIKAIEKYHLSVARTIFVADEIFKIKKVPYLKRM